VIVGLFALAGGAAGGYLGAVQAARAAAAPAPRSAEVAVSRLQADPSLRRHA
jgi:hypothetical protein